MDEKQRKLCDHIRGLNSPDAATWLIEQFPISGPNWGQALLAITHRSWERPEQVKLADYYLDKIPYASKHGYEAFASFMSIGRFLSALRRHVPPSTEDKQLLAYHLRLLFQSKAMTAADRTLVNSFMDELALSVGGI